MTNMGPGSRETGSPVLGKTTVVPARPLVNQVS